MQRCKSVDFVALYYWLLESRLVLSSHNILSPADSIALIRIKEFILSNGVFF